MYHPTRGGTRGGQAEFTWDQVRSDQHRENYLGHSVFAPTGRWQNHKDVNWYNKDKEGEDQVAAAEKRRKELMEVKMKEEEEMNRRLGIKPGQSSNGSAGIGDSLLRGSMGQDAPSAGARTGANRAPLDPSRSRWNAFKVDDDLVDESKISKEDRRAAKKLAKMQVKEERRAERRRRREERGDKRAESSSDDSEKGRDHRGSRSYGGDDRERHHDRRRENGSEYDDDKRRDDRRREERYSRPERDAHSRRDNDKYRRSDRRWSPEDDLDRRGVRHPSRNQRNRSKSPGRAVSPDSQRRRRV